MIKLSTIKANKANPRVIRDTRFFDLVKSIEQFPKMLALRPIVVDANGMVLGGNMRLRALQELKYKEIPDEWVKRADDLTEEEAKRFIVADNVSFGEWNFDELANGWEASDLKEWGLDAAFLAYEEAPEYKPVLAPETTYDDVTAQEIENKAHQLATQMLREKTLKDVMCPHCGQEFSIE